MSLQYISLIFKVHKVVHYSIPKKKKVYSINNNLPAMKLSTVVNLNEALSPALKELTF